MLYLPVLLQKIFFEISLASPKKKDKAEEEGEDLEEAEVERSHSALLSSVNYRTIVTIIKSHKKFGKIYFTLGAQRQGDESFLHETSLHLIHVI